MPEAKRGRASRAGPRRKGPAGQPVPKKPVRRKRATGPGGRTLRVKQVRSGIGRPETYRRTLEALGLRHHQHEIVVTDSPSVRGMLFKVRHLVTVTEEA